MTGLEVEEMVTSSCSRIYEKIVIGEIVEAAMKHPDADRLQVLPGEHWSRNVTNCVWCIERTRVGLKAPCALVGAELPGISIKASQGEGCGIFWHDVFIQRVGTWQRKRQGCLNCQ